MSEVSGTAAPARSARSGVAPRLLAAQTLVLVAGAATTWVVASVVAPSIFHDHLQQAGVEHTAAETTHVDEAFADSLIIALGVALFAAVLLALVVTWWFTRRIQRSTAAVVDAASRITEGRYSTRILSPGLGSEFDHLTDTINDLAARLEDVETTRRRILTDLAHEMRTPIATIEAHLEAVEDGVRELDEPTLAVLHGGTRRLQRLADDIRSVSRAEEAHLDLRPVPVSLDDLLAAAVAGAASAYAAKGVRLTVSTTPRLPLVTVDAQRMAQVVDNLLDNALNHTPEGGLVEVSASRPDPRWVAVEVRDTGAGIAPEHLPHVFERFYRADPARSRSPGGSGIGLTISRALVEAHGGGLSARSDGPGTGATFTIRLPVAPGSPTT